MEPALSLDSLLRKLNERMCVERPDLVPEASDNAWIEKHYPLPALEIAADAYCGAFLVKVGEVPGDVMRQRDHLPVRPPEDEARAVANEHLGAAIVDLLRENASRYEEEIASLFDMMCGPEASSAHLHDAAFLMPRRLREYAYATCDGFVGYMEASQKGSAVLPP